MATIDLGFPYAAVPSRRQIIDNNSTQVLQISNFKVYPNLSPDVHTICPQAHYTVYVSGQTGGGDTKETVYSIPIVFTVDLYVGKAADDVLPIQGVKGPRGVNTLSNDIQYYHFHEQLGLTASSQAASGVPPSYDDPEGQKDSQTGLNTLYKVTNVSPFILPVGDQLYMDVSATQADSDGLSSVVSAFVLDNPTYTVGVEAFYHAGQYTNGARQFIEFYNSSLPDTTGDKLSTDDALLAITFDYERPSLPREAKFERVSLVGGGYVPSGNEVTTSSGDFIALVQNDAHQKTQIVEGESLSSGRGNLTITRLKLYAAEYNKANKAVYDLYKLRSNGVYEPIATRVPIVASSSEYVGNTMASIASGTSALDLQETFFDSLAFEPIVLSHRSAPGVDDGEAIVAVCRENSLGEAGVQLLTLYYEGFYEQNPGYKVTMSSGREYTYNPTNGRWERT